jgi:CHAT domain-containing protein/Tfp pilus assembly protein PilF
MFFGKLFHFLVTMFGLIFLATQPALGQSETASRPETNTYTPGIVVERVVPGSSADKAGLSTGDILFRWQSRGADGFLDSPFELSLIQIEQAPKGPLWLTGRRGSEERSWVMGPGEWGVVSRPDLRPIALSRYEEGVRLAAEGKPLEAADLWRRLATDSQTPLSHLARTWLVFHCAETLAEAQEAAKADDAYGQAIASTGNSDKIRRVLLQKAWADRLLRRRDWDPAQKLFEAVLDSVGEAEQHPLLAAAALHGLGIISYLGGDFSRAEKFYLDSLDLRQRAAPDSLVVSASFQNLGAVAIDRGDLDGARDYGMQALRIRERLLPDSLEVADILHNLGKVLYIRGDLAEAEANYQKALSIRQRLAPDSASVSVSLNALGTVAKERGDLALAERLYLRALKLQERLIPSSLEVVATLNNLGELAWIRHELDLAERYFRRAMAIQQKIGPDSVSVPELLANLAGLASDRGDLDHAEALYRQALEREEKLAPGSLSVADTLSDLGEIACRRGNSGPAQEFLEKAYAIQEKLAPGSPALAHTLRELGDLSRERHDFKQAETNYRRALAIRERLAPGSRQHAETLAALASVRMREDAWEEASQLFEGALNALDSQVAKLGGAESARAGFRRKHEEFYREYIELLLQQGKRGRALDVLERSRARALLETLAESRIDLRHGVDSALLEKERTLQHSIELKMGRRIQLLTQEHSPAQLSALDREIEEMLRQFDEVEGQIRTTSPAFALLMQPRPLTVSEIQEQVLDPGTVLLEYSLGDDVSRVWFVTDRTVECFPLPGRQVIESLARRAYGQMTARNRSRPRETGAQKLARLARADAEVRRSVRALSDILLGPLADSIGDSAKRLLIITDGALGYIPFGALPLPVKTASSKPIPLIAHHEIVIAPSASVVALLRQKGVSEAHRRWSVLVFADPVFDRADTRVGRNATVSFDRSDSATTLLALADDHPSEDETAAEMLTRSATDLGLAAGGKMQLPRLLYSRQEAAGILSMAPPGSARAALDFKASRTAAMDSRLSEYRIVHFATHALINDRHPELSGLVLSLVNEQGRPQNGFLNLQEIYNLDLQADLVVLSACETALGQDAGGEGLIGLTRGFLHAGAGQVVASLWNVSDVATAELMRRFYRAMEREGLSPAAALRRAQLEMMEQERWHAPFFWAAFQISGAWQGQPGN